MSARIAFFLKKIIIVWSIGTLIRENHLTVEKEKNNNNMNGNHMQDNPGNSEFLLE